MALALTVIPVEEHYLNHLRDLDPIRQIQRLIMTQHIEKTRQCWMITIPIAAENDVAITIRKTLDDTKFTTKAIRARALQHVDQGYHMPI